MSAHNPVSSAVAANSHTSVTQRAHYESTTIAQRVLLTFLLIALRGFVSLMVEKYNEGGKKSTFVSQHSYIYFIQKHFTEVYCSHYTTVFAAFSSLSTALNIFCFEPFDIGIIRAPIKR